MPNKPTTLRESLIKEFKEKFFIKPDPINNPNDRPDAVREDVIDFLNYVMDKCLTSHNTELLQKIDGLPEATRSDVESGESLVCRDEVINIINQNK